MFYDTVFYLHKEKAPRSNRFTITMFQECWDMIKDNFFPCTSSKVFLIVLLWILQFGLILFFFFSSRIHWYYLCWTYYLAYSTFFSKHLRLGIFLIHLKFLYRFSAEDDEEDTHRETTGNGCLWFPLFLDS